MIKIILLTIFQLFLCNERVNLPLNFVGPIWVYKFNSESIKYAKKDS